MPFTLATSVATSDATITSLSSTISSNDDGSTTFTNTSVTPIVVSDPKVSLSDSVGAEEFTYTTTVGVSSEESKNKDKEEPPVQDTKEEIKPVDTSVTQHQSEEARETKVAPSSSSKDQIRLGVD